MKKAKDHPRDDGVDAAAAHRDDLTRLYNRRMLVDGLEERLQRGAAVLALLIFDIDGFRTLNETHGTEIADSVLERLAGAMRASAGKSTGLIRYGGDQFAFVLNVDRAEALEFAERLRAKVAKKPVTRGRDDNPVRITVSVGIATAPEHGRTVNELIRRAQLALRQAKAQGGNRVAAYDPATPPSGQAWELLVRFPCPKLVGRAVTMARIEELSRRGKPGPPVLALVEGAAGAGTTRVLQEVARRRHDTGHMIVWTRCSPVFASVPYHALIRALRDGLRDRTLRSELTSALGREATGVLGAHIPEFGSGHGSVTGPGPQDGPGRAALFASLTAALRVLGRDRRLCLVLDDAQHLDSASAELLALVIEMGAADEAGPMFLASVTPPEEPSPALARLREVCDHNPAAEVIPVEALAADQVGEVVDACFPGNDFPDLALKLHQVSGGLCLGLQEALTALVLGGYIVRRGTEWRVDASAGVAIVPDLAGILALHLGKLSLDTLRVLQDASVVGDYFDVELLAHVNGTNAGRVLQAIDEGVNYRLLLSKDKAHLRDTCFTSPVVAELLYQSLDHDGRRVRHHAIGRTLNELRRNETVEERAAIAYHFERAGDERRAGHARKLVAGWSKRVYLESELEDYRQSAAAAGRADSAVRVLQATEALPPVALDLLPRLLRWLGTARHAFQVYPTGHQALGNAMQGCFRAVRAVLEHAPALTFKDLQGRLEFNGRLYEMERWGPGGFQVVADMRQALVESVTLTRAVRAEDIEALALGLQRFRTQKDAWSWPTFLARRGVTGVGVVVKQLGADAPTYVAVPADGAQEKPAPAPEPPAMPSPIPDSVTKPSLPDDSFSELEEIARSLARATETVATCPPGKPAIAKATNGLAKVVARAQRSHDTIEIVMAREGLLVNGVRVDATSLGEGMRRLRRAFQRSGVGHVSLLSGVAPGELETFLRELGETEGDSDSGIAWDRGAGLVGLPHIVLNEYVAPEREIGSNADLALDRDATEVRKERDAIVSAALGNAPSEVVMDPESWDALAGTLTDLVLDGKNLMARDVIARILRRGEMISLDALTAVLERTSLAVASEIARHMAAPLQRLLRQSLKLDSLKRVAKLAERAVEETLRRGELHTAARVLWQLTSGYDISGGGVTPDEWHAFCRPAVARIMRTAAFERTLHGLWTGSGNPNARMLYLIEGCGDQGADLLLQLIVDGPDQSLRRAYARLLKRVALPVWLDRVVARTVSPNQLPWRARNLVSVIDILDTDALPPLIAALQHDDATVAEEATAMLRRLDEVERQAVLMDLHRSTSNELRLHAIRLIGDLGPIGAANPLLDALSRRDSDPEITIATCAALSRLGDERGIPSISGLCRDGPSKVRIAAIWALRDFCLRGSSSTGSIIFGLRDDADPEVRQASLAALSTLPNWASKVERPRPPQQA